MHKTFYIIQHPTLKQFQPVLYIQRPADDEQSGMDTRDTSDLRVKVRN